MHEEDADDMKQRRLSGPFAATGPALPREGGGAPRHRSPARVRAPDGLLRAARALWALEAEGLARLLTGDGGLQVLEVGGQAPLYARVRGRDGVKLVHVVFEEGEDPSRVPLRVLAEATTLLMRHEGVGITSVVLVLTPAPEIPTVCVLGAGGIERGRYRYDVVRLDHFPASELAVHPVLAPLAPLGAHARTADVARARRTIEAEQGSADEPLPEREPASPTARGTADRLTILYLAAGCTCPAAARRLIRLEELMESETFLEIVRLGFDQGWDEGEDRARTYVRRLLARQWNRRFPERAGAVEARLERADFPLLDAFALTLADATDPEAAESWLRDQMRSSRDGG